MDLSTLTAELNRLREGSEDLKKRVASLGEENTISTKHNQSERIREKLFGYRRTAEGEIATPEPSEIERLIRQQLYGSDSESIQSADENIEASPREAAEIQYQPRGFTEEQVETYSRNIRTKLYGAPSKEEEKKRDARLELRKDMCDKRRLILEGAFRSGHSDIEDTDCNWCLAKSDGECVLE